MPDPDRSTPLILVRVRLPGKPTPERIPILENLPGHASRFLRLTYEDLESATDKATLEINNYDLVFPDEPIFDRGNALFLQFGYAGNLCAERELVITSWTPGPTFTVEAQDKGALMNRIPVDQTYYGLRYSDVAAKVAERNGYGPDVQFIETTSFVKEALMQAHMTDAQFLRDLAKKVGFAFFIDGSGFHFHRPAFGQKPRKVLRYFPKDRGELKEHPKFTPPPAAQPGAVTLKGKDPITKKPIEVRADNASTTGRPGLASEIEVIDARTAQTALRPNAGRELVAATSASTHEEAKARADGLYQRAVGVPVKCTAKCFGDPQFQAKTVVEIAGIGRRLSGNYYCKSARHVIEAGSYEMDLTLTRDGTNGAGKAGVKSEANPNAQNSPAGGPAAIEAIDAIDGRTGQTKTSFRPGGPRGK